MKKLLSSVFSRLIFYFLIVMMIPFTIFLLSAESNADSNIRRGLEKQTVSHIEKDASAVEELLESYRHKAYVLSQLPVVKDSVRHRKAEKDLYAALFATMGGNIDLAGAHIFSIDGQFRVSTGQFPERYDIRKNTGMIENGILSITEKESHARKSAIVQDVHVSSENGKFILSSIIRKIINDEGHTLGYVIIDVYTDVLDRNINTSGIFTEELLVNRSDYNAFSLIHPTLWGSYDDFPILKSKDTVKAEHEILGGEYLLIGITDTEPFLTNMSEWLRAFILAFVIGLSISIIFALIFSNSISKRIRKITASMEKVENGDLSINLEPTGLKEIDVLASSFNIMVGRINRLLEVTRDEEEKLREAERKQLESQLNPHFLFNTLNTIKALARINGENDIYTIALRLGKLLRSSLRNDNSEVTLRESIELTESYLMIQKIRFKDKIDYTIEADPDLLDVVTPKLIIQPFAENAVVHGLEPKTGSGRLSIRIMKEYGDRVRIEIEDDGLGYDAEKNDLKSLHKDGHVGLYNTEKRLRMHYGSHLSFTIESRTGEGTKVTIIIPVTPPTKQELAEEEKERDR